MPGETLLAIAVSVLSFVVVTILIPILAYLFKRNDKMHDTNTLALAEHTKALAILIEQSTTHKEMHKTVGDLAIEFGSLKTLITERVPANG